MNSSTKLMSSTMSTSGSGGPTPSSTPACVLPPSGFNDDIMSYIVCVGVPTFAAVILLAVIMTCCIGICCTCRRKRRKKAMVGQQLSGSHDQLEMNASINLATGQINPQVPIVSSSDPPTSASKDNYREDTIEQAKPYMTKTTVTVHHDKRAEAAKTIPTGSLEQTTSIDSVQNSTALLIKRSKAATLQLTSVERMDSSTNCPQSPQIKRSHSYEDVKENNSSLQQDEEQHMYDDVVSALEGKKAEIDIHKHLLLCDPGEVRYEETGLVGIEARKREASLSTKENSAIAVHTPQRKKHDYEEVQDVPTEESTSTNGNQDQYHVLANQMDTNPLQGGIVQEAPGESPVEDKYYSTARVHRLVPVGKPIDALTTDHLYQALDDAGAHRPRRGDYDRVQMRHNTFTGSCDALRRLPDQLARTQGSNSMEKLDPMYDEPYKPQTRSSSVSRVDIYNVDSLFDDPKYVSKRSALFEADSWAKQARSRSPERHVSFSVDHSHSVEGAPKTKATARPAALRKTK